MASTTGRNSAEKMKNNKGYYKILAHKSVTTRYELNQQSFNTTFLPFPKITYSYFPD